MDDPTDVVLAIEEFTKINIGDAVSALDGFVVKENEERGHFFDQSFH